MPCNSTSQPGSESETRPRPSSGSASKPGPHHQKGKERATTEKEGQGTSSAPSMGLFSRLDSQFPDLRQTSTASDEPDGAWQHVQSKRGTRKHTVTMGSSCGGKTDLTVSLVSPQQGNQQHGTVDTSSVQSPADAERVDAQSETQYSAPSQAEDCTGAAADQVKPSWPSRDSSLPTNRPEFVQWVRENIERDVVKKVKDTQEVHIERQKGQDEFNDSVGQILCETCESVELLASRIDELAKEIKAERDNHKKEVDEIKQELGALKASMVTQKDIQDKLHDARQEHLRLENATFEQFFEQSRDLEEAVNTVHELDDRRRPPEMGYDVSEPPRQRFGHPRMGLLHPRF